MRKQRILPATRCRRCCTLTCKHCIKITSAVLLPLLLAIFTVIITLEQRTDSEKQRLEDRELAREQRQQDLNMSILTRENDREIARLQREVDETKRKQDLMIANEKQAADSLNAEKQRNMSLELDVTRYKQEREQYFDELFVSYTSDIGQLLEKNNGSLTLNPASTALASAKTLQVLLHIGPVRAAQLVRFLYKANQLTRDNAPLDIAGALLNDIDLSGSPSLSGISLVGASLNNAIFVGQNVSGADFTRAQLHKATFSGADCRNAIFKEASMVDTNFTKLHGINSTFERANMSYVDMSQAILSFSTFTNVYMFKANLSRSDCSNVTFTDTIMVESNFNASNLSSASFHGVDLTRADFHKANNRNIKVNVSFLQSRINEAIFANATFTQSRFIECSLVGVNFQQAILDQTNFDYSDIQSADFSGATLSGSQMKRSSLIFATFTDAMLHYVTFPQTDLSHANLSRSRCNDKFGTRCDNGCDWQGVLSTYKTIQCNGIMSEEEFRFVRHVDPMKCNQSLVRNNWAVLVGSFLYKPYNSNGVSMCVLVSTPDFPVSYLVASVNISVSQSQRNFVKTGDAVLVVRVRMSPGLAVVINVTDTLNFHPIKNSADFVLAKSKRLYPNATHIQLLIKYFAAPSQSGPLWLDYIDVGVAPRPPQVSHDFSSFKR
ncbi:unnamed protein product [Rotaria magnacalcarata]